MRMNKEYPEALFLLAAEEGRKEEILETLIAMETAFLENPEFMELLASPAVSMEERLTVIEKTFSSLERPGVSFLKILCERGYLRSFPEMVKTYQELMEAAGKVSTAQITSAVELTEEEKAALLQKLEKRCGNTVVAEYQVDSSLLGGMVIEIDGKVMDASLKSRLSDIKDVMSR